MSDTQQGVPASTDKLPLDPPKDQFGNEVDQRRERFPEDSPAAKGETSPPSGQGGATPHDGISYQDQFPPNPPPSESAAEKGEENDRIARGEVTDVKLANDRLAEITGTSVDDQTQSQTQSGGSQDPVSDTGPAEPDALS